MKKNVIRIVLFLVCAFLVYLGFNGGVYQEKKAEGYYRIVLLSDTHLPVKTFNDKDKQKQDKIITAKNAVLDDINNWQDVGEIEVLGDVVGDTGTDEEYAYAKNYFSKLHKPLSFIVGNHDYIYRDQPSASGHYVMADPQSRAIKLDKFKKTFGLSELFYTKKVEGYLLVFLSADSLDSKYLTEISPKQLSWLKGILKKNSTLPTIIFFHAPLEGTLRDYNKNANKPNFVAQPAEIIDKILDANRQIVLWVSGHTHTPATNPSFASDINLYKGRVLNVHNPDMDRTTIWTNSLFLYPDKIVIRTFNHSTKTWMKELERTIPVHRQDIA
jgi:3',5'-cyclic-AMP phosphodiesterase